MNLKQYIIRTGSGTALGLGMLSTAVALLLLIRILGWDPTWRTLGVTPLQPPFFDMHVINDYAACAWKGIDPYAPHACNVDNYNYPPAWLWLGALGVDGSESILFSATMLAAAAIVMVLLLRGRHWSHGIIALVALVSPSVMMGVERGNLDLLILAIVGAAALIYEENKTRCFATAIALVCFGIVLKLLPIFCVSVAARFTRKSFIFASVVTVLSAMYFSLTLKYIFLIHRNVPTTFILSYGYKTVFLGLDHLRSEAGLSPIGMADTWAPEAIVLLVLVTAAFFAVHVFRTEREFCLAEPSVAGTAFLFGAGIYCGTYLLGTNFIYRLMFLLLCVPQLLDWQLQTRECKDRPHTAELGLLGIVLGVLWLNGNASGHSIFLLLPQFLNWFLFFCLAAVLISNLLHTAAGLTFIRNGQEIV